jgi:hypothetical protein
MSGVISTVISRRYLPWVVAVCVLWTLTNGSTAYSASAFRVITAK